MEEMLEDTFDSLEDEDMEEEAQEEVDKILFEITQGSCLKCRISFSQRINPLLQKCQILNKLFQTFNENIFLKSQMRPGTLKI